MDVKPVSADFVSRRSIESLGLDPDYVDFTFPEVMAEAVRRVVSIRGPVARATLTRLVLEPLRGLLSVDQAVGDSVRDVVDQLLSVGDLVEHEASPQDGPAGSLMYITMPRFVKISSQWLVFLGSRPDGLPVLSTEMAGYLERNGPIRYLRLPQNEAGELVRQLIDEGVREVNPAHWLRTPPPVPASDYLDQVETRVLAAPPPGDLQDAVLFDPSTDRGHYRGRWRPLREPREGLSVLRRPQAYGSDRWSIARTVGGDVKQLLDLPTEQNADRACDEAWRIMAALDAAQGTPPRMRLAQLANQRRRLDVDAPPPAWLQRHLAFVGFPIARAKGSLFSFSIDEQAIGHVRELVEERLWAEWIDKDNDSE